MEFFARVLYVEKFIYPEKWSFLTHEHAGRYHMFCVKEGCCTFFAEDQELIVREGEIMIVPPGCSHGLICCEHGAVVEEIMFRLETGELKDAIPSAKTISAGSAGSADLLDKVMRYGNSRRQSFRRYASACLTALLLDLCRDSIDDSPSRINAQRIDNTGYSPITVGVIGYIDEHYADSVLLEDIADNIGCNKSYMCTVFRKDCGITINDYLNTIRILKAAEYISYTNRDIAYICSVVGFSNVGHFNRTFKKFLGMSPGYYKRMTPVNFNETRVELSGELESKLNAVAEQIGSIRNIYMNSDEIKNAE